MKIQKIRLETAAPQLQREFYHQRLDLPFDTSSEGGLSLKTGSSTLDFTENRAATGIYHFAFNIPCNRILDATDWLERRDIVLIRNAEGEKLIDFPNWHAQSVYFYDPAGNIVEFIARRDLKNESRAAFGPESLLEISEIGIVVPDVTAWREEAGRLYGVTGFDKQPALPAFCALGTDTGLFIVVPAGRKWFLTDVPATQNKLTVEFENESGAAFRLQHGSE